MHSNGKVDFLIVGAQKSGTTALASFLAQHPDLFVPAVKEVHFFDFDSVYFDKSTGLPNYDLYNRTFRASQQHQLWGEATPIYMYLPAVAARIYEYNPLMKLVFLLREPAERAFSHYRMQRARGWECWPFTVAAALEIFRLHLPPRNTDSVRAPIRIYSYLSRGFYARQITRFLRLFPKDNCLFVKSEDLLERHEQSMPKIYRFLGVSPEFRTPSKRVFVGSHGQLGPVASRILRLIYSRDRRRLELLTNLQCQAWN